MHLVVVLFLILLACGLMSAGSEDSKEVMPHGDIVYDAGGALLGGALLIIGVAVSFYTGLYPFAIVGGLLGWYVATRTSGSVQGIDEPR